jgi:hypothetical protein
MNLFTGLTTHQIVSFLLAVALFTGYAALVGASLLALWVASRPTRGRVRAAAAWHFVALLWFMLAIISAVWAAPAEKTFVNADSDALLDIGNLMTDPNARLQKVVIGIVCCAAGLLCMVIGALHGGRQKRRLLAAAASEPVVAPAGGSGERVPVSAARS